MKKTSLFAISLILAAGISLGQTIVQSFDTGTLTPGADAVSTFTINQFDTQGGTRVLTKVTFEISLNAYGGTFTAVNDTNPEETVNVDVELGVSAYISGTEIPAGMDTSLSAIDYQSFLLETFGSSDSVVGAFVTAGPNSQDATNLSQYEGTGTYDIEFHSSQDSTHYADGAIDYSGNASNSQGFLTVTYEWVPVPEPTSVAMLILGCMVLGLRRRRSLTK